MSYFYTTHVNTQGKNGICLLDLESGKYKYSTQLILTDKTQNKSYLANNLLTFIVTHLIYDHQIKRYQSKTKLLCVPPVTPPVSMAFLTFSWSSQRRSEKPAMSAVDWAAARCQKQEKWCQWGTFPSNMGDWGPEGKQEHHSFYRNWFISYIYCYLQYCYSNCAAI